MPKRITDTCTLADLEVILASLGITLYANMEHDGRWLVGATGKFKPDGTSHTAATYGSSLAEAAQSAVDRWCTEAGDALMKKPVRS